MRTPILVLLCLTSTIAVNLIANDVVSDYAQVKELLREFYRRSARRFGHDYDPSAIEKAAVSLGDDGTEATANRKIWEEVFENDIVLSLPQAEALLAEKSSFQNKRGKRQALPNPNNFWKSTTIPYELTYTDSAWQQTIRSALRHIESNTCIRFRENGQGDGLRYFRGNGCWSNVGRMGGKQQVSIGYGCVSLGIVAHETLHALGLWHEQSRDDRDSYISLSTNFIIRGTEGNFEKRSRTTSDNMGQLYDYGSVMHYGPKSFTTNWSYDTIRTRDANYQQTIGQREGISFKDAKMVNLRYCSNVCPTTLNCQNEGYTDPNNCYKCRCPPGYGGTLCDRVEETSCGGEIVASDSFQTFRSPSLSANMNCVWRIKSPAGQRIQVAFTSMSFPCADSCSSYVEFKTLRSKASTGAHLCCRIPATSLVSEDDQVVLIMKGSSSVTSGYTGFTIQYKYFGSATVETTRSPSTPMIVQTSFRPTTPLPNTAVPEFTSSSPTPTGSWGIWGAWSNCNRPCGGCGTRQRVRGCYGGNGLCNGYSVQSVSCNQQACPTSSSNRVCNGRIVLPCDLMQKLRFGQSDDTQLSPIAEKSLLPLPRDPGVPVIQKKPLTTAHGAVQYRRTHVNCIHRRALNSPGRIIKRYPPQTYNKQVTRGKRQTDNISTNHGICEKKFTYECPTNLLSIHVGWTEANAPPQQESLPIQRAVDEPSCCSGYYLSGGYCYKN
ncbi:unnamed protein product [Auanema sp. JU1783]|nr:unnamed protein product [Auanema sp. JU1783]